MGASLHVQSDGIRQDFGFLSSSRSWRVTVLPYQKPGIAVPPAVTVAPDGAIDVPVSIEHDKPGLFKLHMAHAPAGAVLENGRFRWKPAGLTGSWRVDFTVLLEQQAAVTVSMAIHVKLAGSAEDALAVQPLVAVDTVTGTQVKLQLKATAKDAGHLLFESIGGLAGVDLNRDTGELTWTPVLAQAGPQQLRFRVHNGAVARDLAVLVRVRRAATPAPVSYCNTYIPQTLENLKQLQKCPLVYRRLFETLRLLRDR